ncbi:diacylglycerol/lipid kinase family protein [Fodinibius saliphilus]|uniref:diacylglycerol/lipid kinase family protein n=1 Tax=Fodinibius saliphilus TaxID=1920650 RepID=UPI0011088D9E|nr:diacylglycerol kinase family protein [Fodinibius saliphilus]
MKRYAFIYNPAARNGKSNKQLHRLKQQIDTHSHCILLKSKKKGDITQLVRQHIGDYDVFVACGGDGTVREIAGELLHTTKELGIIPMGTGNDLCKTLGIPKDMDRALEILFQQTATAIDVGKCNEFIFLNTLGLGFDGLTNKYSYNFNSLPSFLRYIVAAIRTTFTHSAFIVMSDWFDNPKKVIMLSFANGRVEGGNFRIAPEASITDQQLDMVTIRKVRRWLIPLLLPVFYFGKASKLPQVQYQQIDKINFTIDQPVDIHADGEIIESGETDFTVSILSGALSVICKL